ncbi:MAG: 2-C-methyl-D-erythritol 2,4-cyclodiphosphate synthase [Coriobacteriia bacterium]|nr:2-C-methyl-D-erythritol 2,4-cyclodiphosphate synthase [Coriobacteriia bacterium]
MKDNSSVLPEAAALTPNTQRIGLGIDVHAFAPVEAQRALILGGVTIEHERGLAGHSDADVLVHAVMDALLGAARISGAEDIGALFPDTDSTYKNADSLVLLAAVRDKLAAAGYKIIDLDCVLVAQAPRLSPYREQMRANLARVLNLAPEQVGVKATTTERLGFEGREEGISAHAVALVEAVAPQQSDSSAQSKSAPSQNTTSPQAERP